MEHCQPRATPHARSAAAHLKAVESGTLCSARNAGRVPARHYADVRTRADSFLLLPVTNRIFEIEPSSRSGTVGEAYNDADDRPIGVHLCYIWIERINDQKPILWSLA